MNDGAAATASVYEYAPNDYGLYNMAGNVNEWVMDVYRPYNAVDMEEFRPFRGNVYQTKQRNAEGLIADKYNTEVKSAKKIGAVCAHDPAAALPNGGPHPSL